MPKRDRQVIYDTDERGQEVARIELNTGAYAVAAAADYRRVEALFGGNWSAFKNNGRVSVGKSIRLLSGGQSRMPLARAILDAQPGQTVSIIGDDPLDLRRDNLRLTGKPRAAPNVLSIPKATATDEQRTQARALLAEEEKQAPAVAIDRAPVHQRQQPVDRTPPVRQRPERIKRLSRQLWSARHSRRMASERFMTEAQRARDYLTKAEVTHLELIFTLRRAEGLEPAFKRPDVEQIKMANALTRPLVVKPKASKAA